MVQLWNCGLGTFAASYPGVEGFFLSTLSPVPIDNLLVAWRPTEFAAHTSGLRLLFLVGEGTQEGIQIRFFCLQREPISFCT